MLCTFPGARAGDPVGDIMLGRFLPKEVGFFDFFEKIAEIGITTCKEFLALTNGDGQIADRAQRIKELEHEADKVTRTCTDALHRTFITPIERGDIHLLVKRLDDVIDSVDSTASRITMYEITEIRPEAKALAEVLVKSTTRIYEALKLLRDMKNAEAIKDKCIQVYQLENEADTLLRMALVRLFKEEKDAVLVIKWKEIYERLEKATDRCEAVANIIQGVVIEAS